MSLKHKILLFAAIFIIPLCALSNETVPKNTSIFTSWKVYPVSDDCGGFTVTLDQNEPSAKIYLQTYEGNCFSNKNSGKLIKFDKKTGYLKFSVLERNFTEPNTQRIEAEWRFVGYIKNNKLKGKMQFCFIYTDECTYNEKIVLTKTNRETLE